MPSAEKSLLSNLRIWANSALQEVHLRAMAATSALLRVRKTEEKAYIVRKCQQDQLFCSGIGPSKQSASFTLTLDRIPASVFPLLWPEVLD